VWWLQSRRTQKTSRGNVNCLSKERACAPVLGLAQSGGSRAKTSGTLGREQIH
jgi:hypothetical protein